ncbi:hypothetical protein L581_0357 [Serratia fonticola AU-AP2C]|nr:hypothetical protein L581_0357 [Serratia fonticola AU-AP2C]
MPKKPLRRFFYARPPDIASIQHKTPDQQPGHGNEAQGRNGQQHFSQ